MQEHHKRQRRLVLQQRRDLSEFRLTVLTLTRHHGWTSNNYHRGKAQKITHDLAKWEQHLTTTGQPYELITQTVDRFPTWEQTCRTFGNTYTAPLPGTLTESHL